MKHYYREAQRTFSEIVSDFSWFKTDFLLISETKELPLLSTAITERPGSCFLLQNNLFLIFWHFDSTLNITLNIKLFHFSRFDWQIKTTCPALRWMIERETNKFNYLWFAKFNGHVSVWNCVEINSLDVLKLLLK